MHDGNADDTEDLIDNEEAGDHGDAVSDSRETEQGKVMTHMLTLIGCLLPFSKHDS